MSKRVYIVFDNRAMIDTDLAQIMEYMGEMENEQAIKLFNRDHADTSNILYSYANTDPLTDETFEDWIENE